MLYLCAILLSVTAVLPATCGQDIGDRPIRIATGAAMKPLPKTVAYQASVPLVFKVLRERVDRQPLTTQRPEGRRSPPQALIQLEDDINVIGQTLDRELRKLFDAVFNFTDVEEHRAKRGVAFFGDVLNFCCDVATSSQINDLAATDRQLLDHYTAMERIIAEDHTWFSSAQDKLNDYSAQLAQSFDKINDRLKSAMSAANYSYTSLRNNLNQISDHQFFSLWEILQNTQRSVHTVLLLKQMDSMLLCRNHLFPLSIIPFDIFEHELLLLQRTLANTDFELVIDNSQIHRYFDLEITSCSFSSTYIMVTVKIPVKQKGSNWELYQFLSTPFAWGPSTCTILHDTAFVAVSGSMVRPITGAAMQQCDPFKTGLCYIPRFSDDLLFTPLCAVKLLQGMTAAEMNEFCPFQCHSANKMMITEVAQDEYVITHPLEPIELRCNNNSQVIPNLPPDSPGALQLSLPCFCELKLGSVIHIPKRFPCLSFKAGEPKTLHLIPAGWSSLASLKISPWANAEHLTFTNLSQCLNTNWSLNVPHLNLSHLPYVVPSLDTASVSHDSIMLTHVLSIWMVFLTIVLAVILFRRPELLITARLPGVTASGNMSGTVYDSFVIIFSILLLLFICAVTYRVLKLCWQTITLHWAVRRAGQNFRSEQQTSGVILLTTPPVAARRAPPATLDPIPETSSA